MPLAAGSQLGRFRIVRQLGAGAMGEVYLAEDGRIERSVAIKTVRMAGGGEERDQNLRERLVREAKTAGRLVHPHVVTLFEAGEADDVFYLVFEYVEGTDLAARMRRGPPIGVDEAIRIVREAAAGLAAAHRRGIVHRDVKPSNLLLDPESTVKVADFGIAKLLGEGSRYTASGAIVGTPQYLSPEQVRAEPVDGRSDLFSLGAVLYELLARRRAFDGDTFTSLVYQILHAEPPSMIEVRPQVSARLTAVVAKLLAKDREQRFATGEELVAELAAIERERAALSQAPTLGLSSAANDERRETPRIEPTADDPGDRLPRRARWLAAGAAAFVLFVLGLVGIGLLSLQGKFGPTEEAGASTELRPEPGQVTETQPPPEPVEEIATETRDERNDEQEGEQDVEPADVEQRAEPTSVAPVATTPRRLVGAALTFTVSPAAAREAQVVIDGVPRGPAIGSLMTVRPGEHRVEVVAPGFETLVLEVVSRPDAPSPSRLDVTMRPAAGTQGAGRP